MMHREPEEDPRETILLSEPALADWNRPEEDAAWAYLQSFPNPQSEIINPTSPKNHEPGTD